MAWMQVLLLSVVALLVGSLLYMLSRELHTGQTTVALESTPSATPLPIQPPPQQPSPAPESPAATASPSETPSPEPVPTKSPGRLITELGESSRGLSAYLHSNRLPQVYARVFGSQDGQASLVRLSGKVRTQKGKDDAALRTEEFLGNPPGLRIRNLIVVDPSLSVTNTGPNPEVPNSGPNPPPPPADPCSAQCREAEDYCTKTCQNTTTGGAGIGGFVSQLLPKASTAKQCYDDCEHTLHQCLFQCAPSGGPEQPPGGPNAPSEGPDQPPG